MLSKDKKNRNTYIFIRILKIFYIMIFGLCSITSNFYEN